MGEQLLQLLMTVIGVLGSTTAFRFYDRRAARRVKEEADMRKGERDDHNAVRDDLRERVASLESKLEAEYREKFDLLKAIADLKAEVASLRTKLELLSIPQPAKKGAAPKRKKER